MKGKKLYYLLDSLDRKERKQLHYQLSMSNDKRSVYLKAILDTSFKNIAELNEYLWAVLQAEFDKKDKVEQDKIIRRFVDFVCKKIEDLKLLNYLREHQDKRYHILTEITQEKQLENLQEHYLKKTIQFADKHSNNVLKNQCLDWQINLYGQQQKDKILKVIKGLLQEKSAYINYVYHEQLSFFYRLLSNLHLDDVRLLEEEGGIKPTYETLDSLSTQSINPFYAAEYKITKARFAFFEDSFEMHIKDAEAFIYSLELIQEKRAQLLRRIYFIKTIVGFQRASKLSYLLSFSQQVIDISLAFKYRDSFSFFYHQLFLILDNQIDKAKEQYKEHADFFYTKNTLFYKKFIEALILLKNENTNHFSQSMALKIFSELTHSPNYYVSLWSKLLELKIHYEAGNVFLCKSLIERIKTFLQKNNHRLFTHEASSFIYLVYRRKLANKKMMPEKPVLSPLHQFIFEGINETIP